MLIEEYVLEDILLFVYHMSQRRSWSEWQLRNAAKKAKSVRQVIALLGLRPAGGNYTQVNKYIREYGIDTSHFKGQGWNKGMKGIGKPRIALKDILVKESDFQSYKLKKRLIKEGLKEQACELCGWATIASDGRIPLELDHINGNARDNRLGNLRILCPNCHSLQPTHRGKNKKKK